MVKEGKGRDEEDLPLSPAFGNNKLTSCCVLVIFTTGTDRVSLKLRTATFGKTKFYLFFQTSQAILHLSDQLDAIGSQLRCF